MSELRYEIMINAAAESVYAHLTERAGLLRWMGVAVTSDPVPSGDLTWTHENGATMIGRYVELDPPHRVVFSYGWKDDLMGVPPASTRVEIQLSSTSRGTHLTLTHRLLPTDATDLSPRRMGPLPWSSRRCPRIDDRVAGRVAGTRRTKGPSCAASIR